jgi:hypothetical protein
MIKLFYLLLAFPLLTLFSFQCNKEDASALSASSLYTGKVELEGICGRTVISITKGDLSLLPANSYAESWQDESTGISYRNVFMIANICQVDTVLKQGDQISFRVHPKANTQCMVCMAYSPAPREQLPIEIIK